MAEGGREGKGRRVGGKESAGEEEKYRWENWDRKGVMKEKREEEKEKQEGRKGKEGWRNKGGREEKTQ